MWASRLTLNSLRSRLMLLVALALSPTAGMIIYNASLDRERAIAVAEENLQRLTNLAAANEAQSLERARQILIDLSSVPDLTGGARACQALMQDVLKKNPAYINFGLIEMTGNVSCSAVPLAQPVNLGDRAHFRRAILERRFIASNYVFGRVIQKHTINLTYPVIDRKNDVVAVVFAAMDLHDLDHFVKDIKLPPGSLLLTADAEGTLIARRPDPERWFGKKTSAAMNAALSGQPAVPMLVTAADGVERLHTFASVGGRDISDYTVTIGLPSDGITAAARQGQWRSLGALLATSALALLAAWFAGDLLIVRRVRRLAATADRIASGSLGTRTELAYGREEIGQLARSLDDMAAALQKKAAEHRSAEAHLRAMDQRKDEFLAMLAHELRNPLAPISAGAYLLKLGQVNPVAIERTADIIARQVGHMTRLVDDLLDVSRVTRGLIKLSRERVDFRDVVADAVEQIEPMLEARGHRIALDMPDDDAILHGDRKRLVQVVGNLLNNAAKYTPERGLVTLRVTLGAHELLLQVSDNGIGMTPDLVRHVFDLFAQAERLPDRSAGGLGLGLALVRTLVELHGGAVHARSDGLGLGSQFTVRLPRGASPDAPRQPAPRQAGDATAAAAAPRRLRIVLVDDNADAADTLAQLLEAEGHEVRLAYHPEAGLALAAEVAPQVCLLDIGLPDFDGNELARRLRATPATARAVLIAVTGYSRQEDREKALLAGFDHYFVKPLDKARLLALLASIA